MRMLRIDKMLSDSGVVSRSEAARLIRSGAVLVNGKPARSPSDKYPEDAVVTVGGEMIRYTQYYYIMMNKPAGYISATEDNRQQTVLDLLDDRYRKRALSPAGRLDKDTEGLLILSDDGDFVHRVISPKKKVDKTYLVRVDGRLDDDDCAAVAEGVILGDGYQCLPGRLEIIPSEEGNTGYVTIHEGKYHQVKRMLASRGKPVLYLKRLSIGGLELDPNLASGEYRELSTEEIAKIFLS